MASTTSRLVCALALAMVLVVPLPGRADALDPRLETAVRLYREEGAEQALPVFEKLASEFTHGSRTHDQAGALHYVGECHWRLGNFPEAHRHLDRALALERASGDSLSEGKTLNVLGLLSWDEGNYDQAEAVLAEGLAAARVIGDYAYKLFSENRQLTDFFLSGPNTRVRVRIFVLPQHDSRAQAA